MANLQNAFNPYSLGVKSFLTTGQDNRPLVTKHNVAFLRQNERDGPTPFGKHPVSEDIGQRFDMQA